MTHLKVFFRCWLSKATFECKLADVACTVAQVFFLFSKANFHKYTEFYSWKFSFGYSQLWLASQKHVTLLTRLALWSLYYA